MELGGGKWRGREWLEEADMDHNSSDSKVNREKEPFSFC